MLAPLELLCHPCVTKPEDLWGTHVRVKIIACQTVGEEIGRLLETAEFDGSLPLPSGQVEPSVQELPFGCTTYQQTFSAESRKRSTPPRTPM